MCKVTLCGSFHRHLQAFADRIREFESLGCEVLSPKEVRIVDEIGDFLFVASDPYRSIKLVESKHLFAIGASDFVWLVTPDGYVGLSAALEIGVAIAKGKKVFAVRPPEDLTLREYVTVVQSPQKAIEQHYIDKRIRLQSNEVGILLDPITFSERAHLIVDQIGLMLSTPGILPPIELEKKVSELARELLLIYNFNFVAKR